MTKSKVSIMDLRNSANAITLRINSLGGVRVLKNEIVMLKHHRERLLGNDYLVADYDSQILAKRWLLNECGELESEREAVYTELYLRGF